MTHARSTYYLPSRYPFQLPGPVNLTVIRLGNDNEWTVQTSHKYAFTAGHTDLPGITNDGSPNLFARDSVESSYLDQQPMASTLTRNTVKGDCPSSNTTDLEGSGELVYDVVDLTKDPALQGLTLYEKKAVLVNRELDAQGMGRYQWSIFLLCGFGYFLDLLWAQAFGLIIIPMQVGKSFQYPHRWRSGADR